MKLGIMQPYFMPYIGYWQLMHAVDQYVVYDDVNYINRGWINRNRILQNGRPDYFNVFMQGASQNKKINEIQVNAEPGWREKNLRTLRGAYRKAPYFKEAFPVMEEILACEEKNLAAFLLHSLQTVCRYLKIQTKLILSSSLEKDLSLTGEEKLLALCELLGATTYYTAVGGVELYHFSRFQERNIELHFLETNPIAYAQFDNAFVANLSIVDVMMFNSAEKIGALLNDYTLLSGELFEGDMRGRT